MNKRNLLVYALVTALLLLIPLVAMQFTAEVNWTGSDFIFAGVLLFGSGLVYEFATRNVTNRKNRAIIAVIVLAILAFVWVCAATGFEDIFDRLQ